MNNNLTKKIIKMINKYQDQLKFSQFWFCFWCDLNRSLGNYFILNFNTICIIKLIKNRRFKINLVHK